MWYAETGLHTKMEKRLIWCVILERACSLQRPDYIRNCYILFPGVKLRIYAIDSNATKEYIDDEKKQKNFILVN